MSNIVCPVSHQTIDKRAARVGAAATAAVLVAYALSGFWPLLVLVVADYVVRVGTSTPSPIAQLGRAAVRVAHVAPKPMNKGPKVFAWRLGFLMAVVSLACLAISPTASATVAVVLAAFNLLDGVGNLCVGCVIYTYLVLPRFGPSPLGVPTALE